MKRISFTSSFERSPGRSFVFKVLLALLPIVVAVVIENFILPMDFFTFRVWEAVLNNNRFLSGPLYPNIFIMRTEVGDLVPHTPFAVKKEVLWITDRYGFRKRNSDRPNRIVIIGDSNVAGTGLTQNEILSEVLESELHEAVYPYAPANINAFFKERRFALHPPAIIILESIERDIVRLPSPALRTSRTAFALAYGKESLNAIPFYQSVMVLQDRIMHSRMLNYFRSHLHPHPPAGVRYGAEPIWFLQGEKANSEADDDQVHDCVKKILSYKSALESKGIEFIFLPIPNKENIYHRLLPSGRKPTFLIRLIDELRHNNVCVVDTQSLYDDAYSKYGLDLYLSDDTHWNGDAVRITSGEICKIVNSRLLLSNQ